MIYTNNFRREKKEVAEQSFFSEPSPLVFWLSAFFLI